MTPIFFKNHTAGITGGGEGGGRSEGVLIKEPAFPLLHFAPSPYMKQVHCHRSHCKSVAGVSNTRLLLLIKCLDILYITLDISLKELLRVSRCTKHIILSYFHFG